MSRPIPVLGAVVVPRIGLLVGGKQVPRVRHVVVQVMDARPVRDEVVLVIRPGADTAVLSDPDDGLYVSWRDVYEVAAVAS